MDNGVQDRVQLKWYKDSPEIRYSDEDAAACDIRFWEKYDLDPSTGLPTGSAIANPDTVILMNLKKYNPDNSPREIFKWPVKYWETGANNSKRAKPNKRYKWQVRCACEHGNGIESPWSDEAVFNTPNFDISTGVFNGLSMLDFGNEEALNKLNDSSLQISIYPNPSDGVFHLQSELKNYSYIVRDANGRVVSEGTVIKGAGQLDLSSQKVGIYSLEIQTNSAVIVRKIVLTE